MPAHAIADRWPESLSGAMRLTLGPDWQNELWASPFRLRFALNRGGPPLSMFTVAYDRARAIARAALSPGPIVAVIAAYPDPAKEPGAERLGWTRHAPYELLDTMGVPSAASEATWSGHVYPDDPEVSPWEHRAVTVTWDQADIILWNQVACDVGVTPRAPVLSKLIDVERGVSVYAYDDRGMDVTAVSPVPIAALHTQFDAWLLDSDRSRMLKAFTG